MQDGDSKQSARVAAIFDKSAWGREASEALPADFFDMVSLSQLLLPLFLRFRPTPCPKPPHNTCARFARRDAGSGSL